MTVAVSIVIPVLNDAVALQRCLWALQSCQSLSQCEIIVCDGGSSAITADLARDFDAAIVQTEPGRAKQMNAGAQSAAGRWLWFLHADCIPHCASLGAIARLESHVEWGCFDHRIDDAHPALRLIEHADNLRARRMHMPFGDQGIFVRRDVFLESGGYPDVPLLEDVILGRQLSERSSPVVLPMTLQSDARRWRKHGIARTTLLNWRVLWGYFFAKQPVAALAEMYRRG